MEVEPVDTGAEAKMKEDLSRQEGAFGAKMIGKLKKMKCAVFGLRGVGIEVAKNLLLAGPHSVMVCDDGKCRIEDLGTNFYISESDVKAGKSRSTACEGALGEINPNTYFFVHKGEITPECIRDYHVVIVTHAELMPLSKLCVLNDFCRNNGKKFIYAGIFGMMLSIFSDFGNNHEIYDQNGDPERSFVIDSMEIVPQPYASVDEFLTACGGRTDEEVKKLGFKDKKIAACDLLKAKAGVDLDEKRRNTISMNDLLELADQNKATCKKELSGRISTVGLRHLLDEGDWVKLDEIVMSNGPASTKHELQFKFGDVITTVNSTCEIKLHRSNPSVFYIGDVSALGEYKGHGVGTQVKMPVHRSYKSLREQLDAPSMETAFVDMSKFGEELKAHVAWAAIHTFAEKHESLPTLHDKKHAAECVELAKAAKCAEALGGVDEDFVRKVALYARAETNAFAAFAGGVVAQEAMKQTGKYRPISQWIHMNALQMVDEKASTPPKGDRYDHYRTLFGEKFVEKTTNAKFFLVGCGALGCEFMKNIAVTGLGCSKDGAIHITDDDTIELSNLSRQFLFRRKHVGKLKSESAAGSALKMNPEMKAGLKVHNSRVEPKTENEFSDEFWSGLDFVINALDNLKARNYVDSKCVMFAKPLFESGTLGTQANQTIHVPHKTPSYQEGAIAGEGQGIAMCTMTNFPYEPLHCIEWARMMFGQVFEDGPAAYEDLRKNGTGKYLEKTSKNVSEEHGTLKKTLKWVKIASNPTLEQCVKLSFDHFIKFFRDDVKDLIHAFPEDARSLSETKEDKGPFWHGRRRFPRAHEFDVKNESHFEYIYRSSCIFADIFGITKKSGYPSRQKIAQMVASLPVPQWEPPKDLKIQVEEDQAKSASTVSTEEYEEIEEMRGEIKGLDVSKLVEIFPADFEKDDDTNHHVDWITSGANLRAWTRKLKESTRQHCRMIAGRIIAAIATATAAITGLVFLEVYKLLQETEDINSYRWTTLNLATNVFAIELPPDPAYHRTRTEERQVMKDEEVTTMKKKVTCIPEKFTAYDFIEMKEGKDLKITDFIKKFSGGNKGLKITLLYGANMKGGAVYQEINVGFYKSQKMMKERLVKMMRNPMQKKLAQKDLDSAVSMLEIAETQKSQTVLEAYVAAYGPLTDPQRNMIVLSADVEPTDRELEDNEELDIPPIKYYFK
mmetsp:Transcript_626/g.1233  ORF Transcript_626/g.1233 Transcript_626/m.1233 type:complete len:1185 (-) Transcript_626:114-3668(-)